MIYQTLKVAFVAAALAVCGNVAAQDCGGCNGAAFVDYGSTVQADSIDRRCGRGITQQQAASYWAGYCNEDCSYNGGGCHNGCIDCGSDTCGGGCRGNRGGKLRGLFSGNGDCGGCATDACGGYATDACGGCATDPCGAGRGGKLRGLFSGLGNNDCGCGGRSGKLRGLFSGFGNGSTGCGCDMGCFGYSSNCGCDDNNGGFLSGGLLKGGCFSGGGNHRSRNNCGNSCGGKLRGMFAGRSNCDPCGGSKLRGLFSRSRSRCGCQGEFFNEAVGHQYGTAGMTSCVSGCATQACGGYSATPAVNVDVDPTANAMEIPAEVVPSDAGVAVEALEDAAGN